MLNYSFELKLNTAQRRFLSQTAGAVRFVWNHFLAEQKVIRKKENRPTQAEFECRQCGYSNNADVVGAINVLNRGRTAPSMPAK